MTWVKLDDQFFAHPKIVNLDKDAKLLYLAGLTYCAGQLTDGLISAGGVRLVLAMVEARRQAVTALVQAGLWEAAADGAYQVHDYLHYNPSAEQVKRERAATAQRQAEWRERRQATRVHLNGVTPTIDNTESNAVTNGISHPQETPLVTGAPYPYPSRPIDSKEQDTLNPLSTAPVAPACADHKPPDQPTATIPVDNFTPFRDRCWTAYPARGGKKLHKAEFTKRLKAIPSRQWDDLETAIAHYAASGQARRGYAEDPHRFLGHWQDWIEPEMPEPARQGGPHATPQRQPDKLTSRLSDTAAFLADLDDGPLEDPGRDRHPNVALLRPRAATG